MSRAQRMNNDRRLTNYANQDHAIGRTARLTPKRRRRMAKYYRRYEK